MGEEGSGGHTFSEILIHYNWHCIRDRNLIMPSLEPVVHSEIIEYCRKSRGVHFLGVGGTSNHVHLVVQLEPYVGISEFVGRVKGANSHEINKRFGRDTLAWQRGYGVVSFAKKNLPWVLKYVQFQKEHHQAGSINETLKRNGEEGEVVDG